MDIMVGIQAKFANEQFEFSRHALDRTISREISVYEIREAVRQAELLEDYPDDKYGPSCLVLGFTEASRALHLQCSYPSRSLVKIITIYEPDREEWIEFRSRRS